MRTTRLSTIAVFVKIDTTDAFGEITPSVTDGDLTPALPGPEGSQSKVEIGDGFLSLDSPAREILRQISLIVAISGTLAMIVLAYIERKRRESKHASVRTPKVK